MKVEKIYEDEFLLVLDKPAGVVVNRSETTKNMVTLQDWLEKKKIGKGVERSGIVHRLDKETSGILVVAKTEKGFKNLQEQFKQRQVKKTYLSLLHGKLKPQKSKIMAPITRNPFNRTKFGVFVGGRESQTEYEVLEYLKKGKEEFSLVKVMPKTGRTHQIRVHMKHVNHSVVSDELYSGRKTARNDRKWCPRLFLQAVGLKINHPNNGEKLSLEVKLAKDLEAVLKMMKKD